MADLLLHGTSREDTLAAMAEPVPDDLSAGFDDERGSPAGGVRGAGLARAPLSPPRGRHPRRPAPRFPHRRHGAARLGPGPRHRRGRDARHRRGGRHVGGAGPHGAVHRRDGVLRFGSERDSCPRTHRCRCASSTCPAAVRDRHPGPRPAAAGMSELLVERRGDERRLPHPQPARAAQRAVGVPARRGQRRARRAGRRPGVKTVVVTGAGEVFCAGFDLKEFDRAAIRRRVHAGPVGVERPVPPSRAHVPVADGGGRQRSGHRRWVRPRRHVRPAGGGHDGPVRPPRAVLRRRRLRAAARPGGRGRGPRADHGRAGAGRAGGARRPPCRRGGGAGGARRRVARTVERICVAPRDVLVRTKAKALRLAGVDPASATWTSEGGAGI